MRCQNPFLVNKGLKDVKAVDYYAHAFEFVPECYNTPEMSDTAVHVCFIVFHFPPNYYKSKENGDKIVSKDPFISKHSHDRYKN